MNPEPVAGDGSGDCLPGWSGASVEEWVASLPPVCTDVSRTCPDTLSDGFGSTANEPSHSLPVVLRKKGILGLVPPGYKPSASDIYQLALSTRKARDRQHSVVSKNDGVASTSAGERVGLSERLLMLRGAYAAQRSHGGLAPANSHQPLSDGTVGTVSFDSSNVDYDPFAAEEDEGFGAEELLYSLGFGGPPTGLDRIPQRFLQPSHMRGVNVDDLFALQQEAIDSLELDSLGYRGLSGPATRRPSSIVARLYERMRESTTSRDENRRRSIGQPSFDSSAGGLSVHVAVEAMCESPALILKLVRQESMAIAEEVTVTTPVDQPATLTTAHHPLDLDIPNDGGAGSRGPSSLASSRRSSLRRQERVEESDDADSLMIVGPLEPLPALSTASVALLMAQSARSMPPTVYVTPPPSVIFQPDAPLGQSSLDDDREMEDVLEVDPIIAVLQLATEAYRVRLECPSTTPPSSQDVNHNVQVQQVGCVKEELRRELDKTDELLKTMHERLALASSNHRPYDSASLRSVLADMTALLQHQHRLYDQVSETVNESPFCYQRGRPAVGEQAEGTVGPRASFPDASSSLSANAAGQNADGDLASSWLRSFERRLIGQVRKAVRQELRRANYTRRPAKASTNKQKPF